MRVREGGLGVLWRPMRVACVRQKGRRREGGGRRAPRNLLEHLTT